MNRSIQAKWRYNEAARALGRAASHPVKKPPLFYVLYAVQFAVTIVAYYFAARFSLEISAVNTYAAPLWPPTGIALAALFYGGYRLAPAVAIAAFMVNLSLGAPILACIAIAAGNTLESIVGVYLLRNFRFRPYFDRLGDSISFIAVALSVPFVSAIIGPLALVATGALSAAALPATSLTWWVGDCLGALVVAPFLLKWFARSITHMHRSFLHWFESMLFFVVTATLAILVFWDPIPELKEIMLPYLVFVPLTWGALRVGPRFMTAGLITVGAIATFGTIMDVGPFAGSGGDTLLLLQLFIGTVSMIFLLFVAAVEERKRASQELRDHVVTLQENVEEISEADRAKNEFIAILSHELRNPLAPVLSSLELLRLKSASMPEFKETFETMHEQIGRITRLLDDLLDITRISKKKFNLQISRVRLQDILTHSVTTVEETMRKRNHRLTVHIPDDTMWIDADPLRLEQVFVNLLNNAAKYTEPGGVITLSARRAGKQAEIRVRDNGIGLPADMLQAIFEPFKQVRAAGENGTGLGIGLSLSLRFVELHGGTIEAKSAGIGKGSEFLVCLPLVTEMLLTEGRPTAQQPAVEPALPQSSIRRKRRTVLIVDDNEAAARGIAKLLSHSGHDARVAHDGSGALQTLANFRPEIIILDIGLPDASGYDLAQTIRQYLDPQPVLVALTGFGQEEDQRRAYESGFDHHLTKPVAIADLEKILAE